MNHSPTYRLIRALTSLISLIKGAFLRFNPLLTGIVVSATWTLILAASFRRGYQDSWILEGIWFPMAILFGFYLLYFGQSKSLAGVACSTAILVFTCYAAPGLKYNAVYSSTIDASVHFSMMRLIAETGLPDNNAYEFTPGMHLLIAAFTQIAGGSLVFWSKVLPAFMGCLTPLGIYSICRYLNLPQMLAKLVIALSGISLTMLYIPNGTTYAAAVISPLIALIILREIALNSHRTNLNYNFGYIICSLLALMALILWHAVSSVLIPVSMIASGIASIALWRVFASLKLPFERLRISGISLLIVGTVGLYMLLMYWALVAVPLWDHLTANIALFIDSLSAVSQEDNKPLIPSRTAQLSISDLFMVFLIMHARDAALLGLSGLGMLFAVESLWRRRLNEQRYLWLIFFAIIVLSSYSMIFAGTMVSGFAKHGYQRYVRYMVMASPIIAGYGLWRTLTFLKHYIRFLPLNQAMVACVAAIYLIAIIQIYPYQPAIPTAESVGGDSDTPLLWQHQVNTDYQRRLIEFSLTTLGPDKRLFADYVTYQQSGIFMGLESKQSISYRRWTRQEPAYVMLHRPGIAGVYFEQAEYRSVKAIDSLRKIEGVSTVYDNGGSFVLFVPEQQMAYYSLGNIE